MVQITHTYAILEVSEPTYREIKEKLAKFGYADQFHEDGGKEVIDMQGIALSTSPRNNSGQKI